MFSSTHLILLSCRIGYAELKVREIGYAELKVRVIRVR